MTKQRERSIHELYEDDPERADALVFGRRAKVNRRGFLGGAGVAAMGAAVGSAIPFRGTDAVRVRSVGLAGLVEKREENLSISPVRATIWSCYNDRPVNAETPAHLLDPDVTPNDLHFIRNNGLVPEMAEKGIRRLEIRHRRRGQHAPGADA